ncbi:hypothetical protein QR680_009946 [Steinernema hermaphroditum]|uniref:t-SNARE coiled-coil homology domain-containing protein n=1 Tax=Steinernema hermaphroditum TaxID=289476 RepID=A0AA39IM73_9BILA|nr:hypothetical protein QR680_009946 [Steinernema hermaphroditum]
MTVKDRLAELKAAAPKDNYRDSVVSTASSVPFYDDEDGLNEFFDQVNSIRAELKEMEANLIELQWTHKAILENPGNDQALRSRVNSIMAEFSSSARQIRSRLKQMTLELEEDALYPTTFPMVIQRIRRTQQDDMNQKLATVLDRYNFEQMYYREQCKRRIERQLILAGRAVSSGEMEYMIENQQVGIFTRDVVVDPELVAEIEARHADILKLESSVRELWELFQDMSMLVGDMIDLIEFHVENAETKIFHARKYAILAARYEKKLKKRKLVVVFLALLLVAIVIAIIFLTK